MSEHDLRRHCTWSVDIDCDRVRGFGMVKVIVRSFNLRLCFCHGMKWLEGLTISGDVICRVGVNDSIVGRLLLCGHINCDHGVLINWIWIYDWEDKWLSIGSRSQFSWSQISINFCLHLCRIWRPHILVLTFWLNMSLPSTSMAYDAMTCLTPTVTLPTVSLRCWRLATAPSSWQIMWHRERGLSFCTRWVQMNVGGR